MKAWIKKIFGFGLASFFGDFSHEMTISFIPVLALQFVDKAQVPLILGFIASISELFSSVVRIFSGYLTDILLRKKPLIVFGYGMSAVFSASIGYTNSIAQLFLCRVFSYAGSGLREPPRDTLIVLAAGPKNYGKAFGLRNAMDTSGALLGPLFVLICTSWASMQTIFLLSLIPGILALLSIVFFTREIPVVAQQTKGSITLLKRLSMLPRPFIIFLGILMVFELGSLNKLLLLARTQEILKADKNSIPQLLVLLYAIFNLTLLCSEFFIGFISDYTDRFLLLGLFGCGIGALIAFLLNIPDASLAYCVVIFMLFGICTAATTTLKKACVADMLSEDILGIGYGVLQAVGGFSALVSNICIGYLWTYYSAYLGFMYIASLSLIAMILLFIFSIQRSMSNASK